jgi:hypothetical protein
VEEDWLRVRGYLREHRHELAVAAAELYPPEVRVAGTGLLAPPSWIPDRPVPLESIALRRTAATFDGGPLPPGPAAPYPTYSMAIAALDPPRVFQDRPTYRLAAADLRAGSLVFGKGGYFDGIDTGEACAHEFAAYTLGRTADMPLRARIGQPWDLSLRPANVAISTLTLRVAPGDVRFPLHWRDPAKVGHAGGLYQVLPVGIFQAAGDSDSPADFHLWHCMLREFAEELLGEPELTGPIDYEAWPLARRMARGGAVRAWVLGLGVDPLTFATDLLTVVAIEAGLFDELFGAMAAANDEGHILYGSGFGFDESTIERLVTGEPMQAAGAALLRLAWRHRDLIAG